MQKPDLNVIVGLGKTGLSCVHFCARENIPFAVTDSRLDPPGLAELKRDFPNCTLALGEFSTELLNQATRLIVSPGVWLHEPAIAACIACGIPAIGDVELFAQKAQAPIVAITGANGKSTVTTLVGEMARHAGRRVQVGGNLGTPVLDLLLADNTELYVVELSSFQLETTYSLRAAAATTLNISPDHMDRYASVAEYAAAKHRIYHHCQMAILNRDDAISQPPVSDLQQTKNIYFTLQIPAPGEWGIRLQGQETFLAYGNEKLISTRTMRIKGRHNWANALAALALGDAVGLPRALMLDVLTTFPGLAHRCQWVAEHQGVAWYNDSKGTNVGATAAAIDGLGGALHGGKIVLLAGGLGKDADFTALQTPVKQYVRHAVLFGKDALAIGKALEPVTAITYVDDLAAAVKYAQQAAEPGDAVLLSPACASYDMFNNFEHRGQVFMELVQRIAA